MRSVDTKKLLEEDKIFDTIKSIPWRFGDNRMVDIHPWWMVNKLSSSIMSRPGLPLKAGYNCK